MGSRRLLAREDVLREAGGRQLDAAGGLRLGGVPLRALRLQLTQDVLGEARGRQRDLAAASRGGGGGRRLRRGRLVGE